MDSDVVDASIYSFEDNKLVYEAEIRNCEEILNIKVIVDDEYDVWHAMIDKFWGGEDGKIFIEYNKSLSSYRKDIASLFCKLNLPY